VRGWPAPARGGKRQASSQEGSTQEGDACPARSGQQAVALKQHERPPQVLVCRLQVCNFRRHKLHVGILPPELEGSSALRRGLPGRRLQLQEHPQPRPVHLPLAQRHLVPRRANELWGSRAAVVG
jgi:hypothetical protein